MFAHRLEFRLGVLGFNQVLEVTINNFVLGLFRNQQKYHQVWILSLELYLPSAITALEQRGALFQLPVQVPVLILTVIQFLYCLGLVKQVVGNLYRQFLPVDWLGPKWWVENLQAPLEWWEWKAVVVLLCHFLTQLHVFYHWHVWGYRHHSHSLGQLLQHQKFILQLRFIQGLHNSFGKEFLMVK